MTDSIEFFDALSFPFSGIRLIEASAGTGKTYSLSNLYIRLLIGHGEHNDSAFIRPLAIDQILVLTFTRAATSELKERIYQRIQDTLECFLNSKNCNDPFLLQLYKDTVHKPQAIDRLRYAATLIDQASIYTLHSFCQRIVKDNSFALQHNSQAKVELDSGNAVQNVLLDMWRQLHSSDTQNYQVAMVRSCWSSFENFSKFYSGFLSNHLQTPLNKSLVDGDEEFSTVFKTEYYSKIESMKSLWLEQLETIKGFYNQPAISRANLYTARIEKMTAFCLNPFQYLSPAAKSTNTTLLFEWFISNNIPLKKNNELNGAPPLADKIEALLAIQPQTDTLKLKQWLLINLRKRWQQYKLEQHIVFPADILNQLSEALSSKENALVDKLRVQFPVAMIDEFQDTDDAQYTIFKRLYDQPQKKQKSSSLVLIGDPKQAIYKFRGADLYTYINAKRDIPLSQQYHMKANWRSSSYIVEACNAIFSLQDNAFMSEDIPFISVDAEADSISKKPLTGISSADSTNSNSTHMHFCYAYDTLEDKKPISSGVAKSALFNYYANKVSALLSGNEYRVNDRTILSSDICILTRSRTDAQSVKELLFQRGIASAYLSKDSVFKSHCAEQLKYCLAAILKPQQTSAVKTALSTHFYQLTDKDIQEQESQADSWHILTAQFLKWQQHWQQHGILSMLHQWAKDENIYNQLKSLHNGLRWITDFQHLAQLLQEASIEHSTIESTYDFLCEQVYLSTQDKKYSTEEQSLRLDNDKSLISITTIHASKGLEYPIVIYPYAGSSGKGDSPIIQRLDDQQQFQQCIDFSDDQEVADSVQHQVLTEEIRLLYVALTRAKYACFVGFANTQAHAHSTGFGNSALAYILNLRDVASLDDSVITNRFTSLSAHSAISFDNLNINDENTYLIKHLKSEETKAVIENQKKNNLVAPKSAPQVKQSWSISSYSQIAYHREAHTEQRGKDELWQATEQSTKINLMPTSTTYEQRLSFPKGAHIGQFLHAVLEEIDFSSLLIRQQVDKVDAQAITNLKKEIELQLTKYALEYLKQEWLEILAQWIIDIVNCSLPTKQLSSQQPNNNNSNKTETAFSLAQINKQQLQKEMHFYFSINAKVNTRQIDQLLTQHGYLDAGKNPLSFNTLHGLLTGFIDLLVEHQGKYYIVDYKSNYLGQSLEYYTQASMQQAINKHHYDVQYILYTLAIHRLLKQHDANYDYDKHIGGSYYLFLRGMNYKSNMNEAGLVGNRSGVFFDKPKFELIDALDQLFSTGS